MREPDSLDQQSLEGSASGPCKTHYDLMHPKCRNHDCCIGYDTRTCQAEPPEYQSFDEDRLLDLFKQYEEGIPG